MDMKKSETDWITIDYPLLFDDWDSCQHWDLVKVEINTCFIYNFLFCFIEDTI
jgi:hypothetical protein